MSLHIFTRTTFVVAALVAATSADRVEAALPVPIAQTPLDEQVSQAPLNMLVMGKDHKLYYEAYNDASDLDGDGIIDVGYKPDQIDYYGSFRTRDRTTSPATAALCYVYSGGQFIPSSVATGTNLKHCGGSAWSGDFLNYLTTSRIDALRKVLYGGRRVTDTDDLTVIEGSFVPQDGHTWGKEYASATRDGYNIANYAPLTAPTDGTYHLFAVTSLSNGATPQLRVMTGAIYRIWEWVSIERPVGGDRCLHGSSGPDCLTTGGGSHPGHPANRAGFDTIETTYAIAANQYGSDVTRSTINCNNNNCNPNGPDVNYMSLASAKFRLVDSDDAAGNYQFCVDGDDAVDVEIREGGETGTVIASAGWYGGHGFANNCNSPRATAAVALVRNGIYHIRFRHEEASGGDGYLLRWRKTSGDDTFDWRTFDRSDSAEGNKRTGTGSNNTDFTFSFYNLAPSNVVSSRTDYNVRVKVCPDDNASFRESNCKLYEKPVLDGDGNVVSTSTNYKPTGILHDYGEVDRMFFGLLTGSQFNNLEGGVLRENIKSFASEVDPQTGIFTSSTTGLVATLNSFRVVGFGYPSDPTSRNYTYNWGNCSNLGTRGINNGECRMWGNPIGEMMFEALRYFAGATAHTGYASGGASQGVTEETDLGLPKPAWKDPYKAEAEGGLGYLSCAKPVMTVISDINPSYDSDLPGNPWGTVSIPVPSTLSTFSFATQGEELWEQEFGGSAKNVFIGQVGSATDGQPTSKSASSFGNIRGLAPEEPTKRGSFAAAMVANYGWTKSGGINALSPEKVRTYAIALASPLPRIDFPVDDEGTTISLVPLGKSVGGCFGTDPAGTFQPTNTIVDFYVEQLVNGPGFPEDATVNGGRPYAVFRINYEDVEQGNDHDMDAIVRYEVAVNASGNVDITLRSEYAAGCVIQHMGYVISGTNQDGVYLEVRDYDTSAAASPAHWFNTPPGTTAGQCSADLTTPPCNGGLPLVATRTFTPGVGSESAKLLESPLWYAAKYGGFSDRDGDRKPNLQREWDEDEDGNPDNYFLVTNALSLREQLDEAFARIESDSKVSSAVAASGARKVDGFLAYVPEYSSKDWTGDLKAFQIDADGKIVEPPKWSAVGKLPTLRTIKVAVPAAGDPTKFELKDFTAANIGTDAAAQEAELGFTSGEIATKYGASITPNEIVAFLKGDQTKEVPSTFKDDGIAAAGKVFRYRSRVIGDIVNSQPEVLSRGSFGYTQLPASLGGGRSGAGSYGKFVLETKLTRKPVVFVGSNGGMLHAIDASDGTSAGTELFAVVPNYALPQMGALADPLYARGDDFPYIVDGLMGQGDARIDDSWRSVLLLSPGRGGGGMLGLDVTDPATDGAELLFEFQSPELGNYLWRGQVILAQDNKWYALFGNGVNNASGQPRIFLVDLATGDAKSIAAGSPDAGGTNGMVSIAAVDGGDLGTIGVDGAVFDGKIDTVFGADYAGNIWRFDLSSADPDDWEVAFTNQPLFTAETSGGDPQNITGAINVFLHPTEDFIVYFGSGRFLLEDDLDVPPSPTVESFYAVWGKQQSNRTDLVEQKITKETVVNNQTLRSTTTLPRGASSSGWVIDLAPQGDSGPVGEGERFVGEPRLELGRAIFTTFEVIGDQCAPGGGINRLYSLNAVSGGAELTFDSCTAGSECAPNQSGTVGSVELRDADGGYSAPALSPPLVVNPAGAVIPGKDKCVPGVDPDCPLPDDPEDSLTGRQCLAGLSVLLPEGLRKFSDVQCGRASWRQIR